MEENAKGARGTDRRSGMKALDRAMSGPIGLVSQVGIAPGPPIYANDYRHGSAYHPHVRTLHYRRGQDLITRFSIDAPIADMPRPRYNLAPTQEAPVVVRGSNRLVMMRWGLIPFWARTQRSDLE